MIRLWLALALAGLIFALGCGALHYRDRAREAEARVAGYEEAVRMRRAQDARQAQIRADAAALDRDLTKREGHDAPLSDYLSDVIGRLWP